MDFSSDTSAPAHPAVLDALHEANTGMAGSYGNDAWTDRLTRTLTDVFETPVKILPVVSGTAANALALSLICRPDEAIACHREAHIERDERGAPEFYTGGGKLHLLGGDHGRINRAEFTDLCARIDRSFVHETPVSALSMTNLTECGAAYSVDDIRALTDIAKAAGLCVHLDGARLANALVSTGASPAEMTWKSGVDILSLGFTKGGALGCELICLFGDLQDRFDPLLARAKRGGHLPPKMRFLSAQALAMLDGDLWLTLAAHANHSARALADALSSVEGVDLAHPVDGNEVFANMPDAIRDRLFSAGLKAYPWIDGSIRLVCNWQTQDAEIDAFVRVLSRT